MSKVPPALSVRDPWAWLLLHGKDIENRTWRTKYRGPVLIHCSKRSGTYAERELALYRATMLATKQGIVIPAARECGGIIGVANLVDVVTASDSPWFERHPVAEELGLDSYGWVFADARPVRFYPMNGRLGLWDIRHGQLAMSFLREAWEPETPREREAVAGA